MNVISFRTAVNVNGDLYGIRKILMIIYQIGGTFRESR